MKSISWDLKKGLLLPLLLLLMLLVAGIAGTAVAHADGSAPQKVGMNPGETYDISDAGINTTITLDKPGDYTIKGQSTHVRIVMKSDGVNLHLARGVNINCGIYSNVGSRTPAILVEEVKGTMKIITKQGADVYLEGYMCPAIEKDGTTSCLVFETEDTSDPGTITAKGGAYSAGIGSVLYLINNTMGNLVFNSGNIVASGQGGAGIGGSDHCSVSNITVNGGSIEAHGGHGAAAIGGGSWGSADGITINGGVINAQCKRTDVDDSNSNGGSNEYHDSGEAAIGSGYDAENGASNIYIRGGTVVAYNEGDGAAIGAGQGRSMKNLQISGGTIDATCTGGGTAIGSGQSSPVADISISGGNITAQAKNAPAIGVTKDANDASCKVSISGGTITAKGHDGAGPDIGGTDKASTTITGGSVKADHIQGTVVNDKNAALHKVSVDFRQLPENSVVSILSNPVFSSGYSYQLNNVWLLDHDKNNQTGYAYLWLPDTNEKLSRVTVISDLSDLKQETDLYYGNIACSAQSGYMNPATTVVLTNGANLDMGIADGIFGEDHLLNMKAPKCEPGTVITGYETTGGSPKQVADADGTLVDDVAGYTDADGTWAFNGTETSLKAMTRPCEYTVHFDGNQPRSASTKVTGTMDDITNCECGREFALFANGFSLPGYDFDSWNTKADGSGDKYNNSATIKTDLSQTDGDTVTLYAQWKPKTYNLTLDAGSAGGSQEISRDMTFDAHEVLPDVPSEWKDSYHSFHCWIDEYGNYYDDEEDFCNLVQYDPDGNPKISGGSLVGLKLTALWIEHGRIAVTVTDDGKPLGAAGSSFTLTDKNGTQYTPPFTLDSGVYTYVSPSSETDPDYVPFGEYELSFEYGDSYARMSEQINFQADATARAVFDYYTVSIVKDPVYQDDCRVTISGDMAKQISEGVVRAPDNAELTVNTDNIRNGYHFDGYSVLGTEPAWTGTAGPKQSFLVQGTAELMTHLDANTYTVHFDPNGGAGVSGEMKDQDMVYNEPQKLFASQFTRPGGSFALWSENKDGSGSTYEDTESVKNLTAENGGTVTLYAQWNMTTFNINYDLNGGQLPDGKTNPDRYWADSATFTLNNPHREDYYFSGWLGTDLTSPQTDVTIKEGSTGDRSYAAIWVIKQYIVQFAANGGTPIAPAVVPIHQNVPKPDDPARDGFTFDGWYSDEALTTPYDFDQGITEDMTLYAKWTLKPSTLLAKMTSKGKKALIISWLKVPGADGYDIFFSKCTKKKDSKMPAKIVKSIGGSDTLTWTKTKLKKGKAYKAYVRAYIMKDGRKQYVRTSPLVHAYTANGTKKITNAKKVTVNKARVTLKKGKTFTIKAKVIPVKKDRTLAPKTHAATLRYLSTDTKIASVTKGGKIKAKAAGTCTVYVYAHNGVYKKIAVIVK